MTRAPAVALAGLTVAGVMALVARRIDRRWADAPDVLPEHRDLPRGHTTTVTTDDGAELAVAVVGDGPDVVLAHCWMGAREIWAPVAHRLADAGHRVTCYDQRGHGRSTAGGDGYTLDRLGADLLAVIEHVDAQDAVLCGHSMGGMSIMAMVAHHPEVAERIRALVLVATAAHSLSRGPGDRIAHQVMGSPALDPVLRAPGAHAFVRGAVGAPVRRGHLTLTRDAILGCQPDARSGLLRAMQAMDLRDVVATIDVPATVVVGTRDRLTPPRLARSLASAIPGAELEVLHGFGHMLPLEAPDEVARLIAKAPRAGGITRAGS